MFRGRRNSFNDITVWHQTADKCGFILSLELRNSLHPPVLLSQVPMLLFNAVGKMIKGYRRSSYDTQSRSTLTPLVTVSSPGLYWWTKTIICHIFFLCGGRVDFMGSSTVFAACLCGSGSSTCPPWEVDAPFSSSLLNITQCRQAVHTFCPEPSLVK